MFTINEINARQLAQMLNDEGLQVKLIDVRSPMEIVQGVIPGAEHIPLHLIPGQIDDIPEDQPVIFYCRTGARSGQACAYLSQLGRQNTLNLRGGVMAWMQDGLAVA